MGGGVVSVDWLANADRSSPWPEVHAFVVGLGRSGMAAADALLEVGARVTVVDGGQSAALEERATIVRTLDGTVHLGPDATAELPQDVDLVIASPGWQPDAPILVQAAERGLPIWTDVELAWRFMHPDRVVPWLGITGTNGKTTTTQMLTAMLTAAGLSVAEVGNIGRPPLEALADEVSHDVFVVELSSFQLHHSPSLRLHSAAVLNLQPDHLEWYQWAEDPYQAYADDKARIFHQVRHACVYNVQDRATEAMVEEADVVEGARAIGFTLGVPGLSVLGVVDEYLVDRAFIAERRSSAQELAAVSDVQPNAPHNVANALAAAALARSFGVPPTAVRDGLRAVQVGAHKIETVAEVRGIRFVDDSKATNPHAVEASLAAYESVVWLAGGQAKGTSFDELVRRHRDTLRGAVLFGVDRQVIADALARHAPEVPVIVLESTETGVMAQAVARAVEMAQPGDVVLLAPGCASKDIWSGYDARGDAFVTAVQAWRADVAEWNDEGEEGQDERRRGDVGPDGQDD
ncbi:UDP-N-acetylmuramoyl-L-alanine--D-glutamate ligase [Parenemella sanctibonifatiensis]|uniref:UDP-N-acetylmuramoylalanine--D-glutamate ligase n=1 Tax=Parenemella sanctibonifatiensis TaxID=2016505 RepID=A0A255EJN3_9ACTN|nr:UDP-N-acetylmuramoyl-L-alanine--D-glutamate ligase [Parenemella sanctibonifatiensis]